MSISSKEIRDEVRVALDLDFGQCSILASHAASEATRFFDQSETQIGSLFMYDGHSQYTPAEYEFATLGTITTSSQQGFVIMAKKHSVSNVDPVLELGVVIRNDVYTPIATFKEQKDNFHCSYVQLTEQMDGDIDVISTPSDAEKGTDDQTIQRTAALVKVAELISSAADRQRDGSRRNKVRNAGQLRKDYDNLPSVPNRELARDAQDLDRTGSPSFFAKAVLGINEEEAPSKKSREERAHITGLHAAISTTVEQIKKQSGTVWSNDKIIAAISSKLDELGQTSGKKYFFPDTAKSMLSDMYDFIMNTDRSPEEQMQMIYGWCSSGATTEYAKRTHAAAVATTSMYEQLLADCEADRKAKGEHTVRRMNPITSDNSLEREFNELDEVLELEAFIKEHTGFTTEGSRVASMLLGHFAALESVELEDETEVYENTLKKRMDVQGIDVPILERATVHTTGNDGVYKIEYSVTPEARVRNGIWDDEVATHLGTYFVSRFYSDIIRELQSSGAEGAIDSFTTATDESISDIISFFTNKPLQV